jgi:tetratricopeptide (TPR) repeat protein
MTQADDRNPILLAAALVVAAFAAHARALGGGFVFDDHLLLLGRDAIVRRGFVDLWLGTSVPDYWPLSWSTLWLEWRVFGERPWPYHLVNLLLHCGAAVLLWRVLRALRLPGAWLAALLFAVHPVGVESVAWISERKNVLSAVLALAAVLAWVRADDERRPGVTWPAVGLFALALLAKTSVVVIPVVLAGIVVARRGRIARPEWLRLAPLFAAALAAGVVTLWFQHRNAMDLVLLRPRGPMERLGGAGWSILSYLERALVPIRVSFVYPEWSASPESAWFYVPLAFAVVAPLVAWRLGGRWGRRSTVAYAYFVISLLPVVGLVDIAYLGVGPVSNHLQYLAMIGPLSLAAWAITSASARWPTAVKAGAAVAVVALGASTMRRAATFESDLTLWRAAASDAPDQMFAVSMVHRILVQEGKREAAIHEVETALAAARDPATRLRVQSLLLRERGRLLEAAQAAAEAERIRPDPAYQHDLGWALLRAGYARPAVDVFGQLYAIRPDSDYVAFGLGVALGAANRVEEARDVLRRALALGPRKAKIHEAYAMALTRLGQIDEARPHVAFSLGVRPDDPHVDAQLASWRAVMAESPPH